VGRGAASCKLLDPVVGAWSTVDDAVTYVAGLEDGDGILVEANCNSVLAAIIGSCSPVNNSGSKVDISTCGVRGSAVELADSMGDIASVGWDGKASKFGGDGSPDVDMASSTGSIAKSGFMLVEDVVESPAE